MSLPGFNFKQAFAREKPHSSVTDWVEIMTASQVAEESYEGMPELVDAINLQTSGPTEVARALRKKIKHGGPHQQYRAIVIMRLLVDNVPQKIKSAFTDPQFLDVLKGIWTDIYVDKRVKKRLSTVLLVWQEQFKDDASMSAFAGLHARFKRDKQFFQDEDVLNYLGQEGPKQRKARLQNEKKERQEAERREREARGEQGGSGRQRRRSFNFERDKVKVTSSIVDASQASSNLINAIKRANLDTDTLEENEEVQSWLTRAQNAKKVIVRYTQLVENEELIGTLIETNERLQEALNTYTQLTAADGGAALADGVAQLYLTSSELDRIQTDNHAVIQAAQDFDSANTTSNRSDTRNSGDHSNNPYYHKSVHPDLADLDFSPPTQHLPPPIRPTSAPGVRTSERGVDEERRGSLSDYSDYESSDGETYIAVPKRRNYVTVSDNSDNERPGPTNQHTVPQQAAPVKASNNPFADPFA